MYEGTVGAWGVRTKAPTGVRSAFEPYTPFRARKPAAAAIERDDRAATPERVPRCRPCDRGNKTRVLMQVAGGVHHTWRTAAGSVPAAHGRTVKAMQFMAMVLLSLVTAASAARDSSRDFLNGDTELHRLLDEVVGDARSREGDDALRHEAEQLVVAARPWRFQSGLHTISCTPFCSAHCAANFSAPVPPPCTSTMSE